MNTNALARFAYVLLRIVAGWMFFQGGAALLFGWFGGVPDHAPPEAFSQIWIGKWMEVVGGLLIALGLFTRPTAFLLSGEMAVAYWQFHFLKFPGGGWSWPTQNGGANAVLYCFLFLYMAFQGAGAFSLDAMLFRKSADARDG